MRVYIAENKEPKCLLKQSFGISRRTVVNVRYYVIQREATGEKKSQQYFWPKRVIQQNADKKKSMTKQTKSSKLHLYS